MIKPVDQLVSVDSSVWIDYFRTINKGKYPHLNSLIRRNLVAVCEPVIAEIVSGSRNAKEYTQNEFFMRANIILETPDGIWEEIAQKRYELMRLGHRVNFLDIWIAHSAYYAQTYLWTLDKDFEIIQKVIPFKFYEGGA